MWREQDIVASLVSGRILTFLHVLIWLLLTFETAATQTGHPKMALGAY